MEENCDFCGGSFDRQGLKNHIRLTDGMGHGPAGVMPDEIGGHENGDSEVIRAEDLIVEDPRGEGEISVQEAFDRIFDLVKTGTEQTQSRINEFEQLIESQIGSGPECPKCGDLDPNPMEGIVASAHPDLVGSFDWVCSKCNKPFN